MCFVNSQNVRDLRQPFGGTKAVGTGREGGTWSYEVFLEPKNVCRVAGLAPHSALGSLRTHGQARTRRQDHPRAVDVPDRAAAARTRARRQDAIDGHVEIGRRCRELGVDTIVVFDTHWLVNANYHINCAPHFKGIYTSNELPHFISNMAYEFPGNPALGQLLAQGRATSTGVETLAHDAHHARPRVRHAGADALHERRPALQGGVGVGAVHGALPGRQRAPGLGHAPAVEEHYDGTVAFFASGSLVAPLRAERPGAGVSRSRSGARSSSSWTTRWSSMWQARRVEGLLRDAARVREPRATAKASCTTPRCCSARSAGSPTTAGAEVVTPYFGTSGTGQINAVFPVTPQDGRAIPKAVASPAEGYTRSRRGSEGL